MNVLISRDNKMDKVKLFTVYDGNKLGDTYFKLATVLVVW